MKTARILAGVSMVCGILTIASGNLPTVATAATVGTCAPVSLTVSVGRPQGAAGTSYYPIIFRNRGPACALWGVPAIQPVRGGITRSHVAVGAPARNVAMGQMPVRHVVATRAAVSDAFGVTDTGNYPTSTCRAKNAGAIVVSLGRFIPPLYLHLNISVCTKLASTTTRLIVAGASGQ